MTCERRYGLMASMWRRVPKWLLGPDDSRCGRWTSSETVSRWVLLDWGRRSARSADERAPGHADPVGESMLASSWRSPALGRRRARALPFPSSVLEPAIGRAPGAFAWALVASTLVQPATGDTAGRVHAGGPGGARRSPEHRRRRGAFGGDSSSQEETDGRQAGRYLCERFVCREL